MLEISGFAWSIWVKASMRLSYSKLRTEFMVIKVSTKDTLGKSMVSIFDLTYDAVLNASLRDIDVTAV
jgi:hypothetical protein